MTRTRKDPSVTLTISAVLILAAAALTVVRARRATVPAAVVLFLLGFFTAGTGAYGPIHHLCESVATTLAHLHP